MRVKAIMLFGVSVLIMASCSAKPEMNEPVRVVAPSLEEPEPDIELDKLREGLKDVEALTLSIVRKARGGSPIKPTGKEKESREKGGLFHRLYNDDEKGWEIW